MKEKKIIMIFFSLKSIYLDYLKDPDSAVRLVKLSNSLEGARMVAR